MTIFGGFWSIKCLKLNKNTWFFFWFRMKFRDTNCGATGFYHKSTHFFKISKNSYFSLILDWFERYLISNRRKKRDFSSKRDSDKTTKTVRLWAFSKAVMSYFGISKTWFTKWTLNVTFWCVSAPKKIRFLKIIIDSSIDFFFVPNGQNDRIWGHLFFRKSFIFAHFPVKIFKNCSGPNVDFEISTCLTS